MSAGAAPRDWDAATYDRVSAPQVEWAGRALDRLELSGHETVLDAGCGSGRVTGLLLERLPRGRVVAVDAAPSMVKLAREALPEGRATVQQADLARSAAERPFGGIKRSGYGRELSELGMREFANKKLIYAVPPDAGRDFAG